MKILFVSPPLYLPNRLHRIRAFDLIKILCKKHEVHLLSLTTEKNKSQEFDEIKKNCKSATILKSSKIKAILNCLRFLNLPYEVSYCYSEEAKKEIEKIIQKEKIDLVYAKRLRSAIFIPKMDIPVVLDTTDAMSMFYQRMSDSNPYPKKFFYSLEALKYKLYEKETADKIKNWIVCSNVDKEYLQKLNNKISISVIPNTVDTNYFKPKQITNHESLVTNHSLLFRGLMDKPVNIDAINFFVRKIFPLVKDKVKDVKLFIVGPNPSPLVKSFDDKKNIFVTGYVEDAKTYIDKTLISICPVRIGSGTRHKILQAWSMGKPVVSTTIGAEGLLYKDRQNILIADDPKNFADKIRLLFNDKKLYTKLAKNGKSTVDVNYSLNVVGKKIDSLIRNVEKKNKKN